MQRNLISIVLVVFGATVLLTAFQNCGSNSDTAAVDTEEMASFFAYGYSEKPDFFTTINLLKPAGAVANLNSFKFFGTVAYPDNPLLAITYQVKVLTTSGAVMCPTQSGTLIAGLSYVEFDCVSAVTSARALVEFRVSANRKTQTFKQIYEN